MRDEQVLFLSDAAATGYMGAEFCNIHRATSSPSGGCGGVGLIRSRALNGELNPSCLAPSGSRWRRRRAAMGCSGTRRTDARGLYSRPDERIIAPAIGLAAAPTSVNRGCDMRAPSKAPSVASPRPPEWGVGNHTDRVLSASDEGATCQTGLSQNTVVLPRASLPICDNDKPRRKHFAGR